MHLSTHIHLRGIFATSCNVEIVRFVWLGLDGPQSVWLVLWPWKSLAGHQEIPLSADLLYCYRTVSHCTMTHRDAGLYSANSGPRQNPWTGPLEEFAPPSRRRIIQLDMT